MFWARPGPLFVLREPTSSVTPKGQVRLQYEVSADTVTMGVRDHPNLPTLGDRSPAGPAAVPLAHPLAARAEICLLIVVCVYCRGRGTVPCYSGGRERLGTIVPGFFFWGGGTPTRPRRVFTLVVWTGVPGGLGRPNLHAAVGCSGLETVQDRDRSRVFGAHPPCRWLDCK